MSGLNQLPTKPYYLSDSKTQKSITMVTEGAIGYDPKPASSTFYSQPNFLRSTFILRIKSPSWLPSSRFSSDLPTKILCVFLNSSTLTIFPPHYSPPNFTLLTTQKDTTLHASRPRKDITHTGSPSD